MCSYRLKPCLYGHRDFEFPLVVNAIHPLETVCFSMTQLVRAVESVLSPLGWGRTDIRRQLPEAKDTDLTWFSSVSGKEQTIIALEILPAN